LPGLWWVVGCVHQLTSTLVWSSMWKEHVENRDLATLKSFEMRGTGCQCMTPIFRKKTWML